MIRLTRRAALGAAALLALRPARALAFRNELDAVFTLVHREDAAAAAYRLVALRTSDPLLDRISRQDAEHALALRNQLEGLTVTAAPPPPDAATTDSWAAPLAAAPHRRAVLAAAIALEEKLDGAYADAARAVHDAGMLQTLATIAGNHAQHRAVLRAAAGRPPLDEPGVSARWRNP